MEGKITRIITEKGYGFVAIPGEKDVFFHVSGSIGFGDLAEGMEVEFDMSQDEKSGRECGVNVVPV